MIVAFGADHTGFELKKHLIEATKSAGHEIHDVGTDSSASVDYPEFGEAVAAEVISGRADLGVVICSNGVGISITANKVPGIRCALCHTAWGAARARQHADANVLALGAMEIGVAIAEGILAAFLSSTFEGGRHERRVAKMMNVERRGIAQEATQV